MLAGREFVDDDTARTPASIVISRGVSREWFGAEPAMGRFVDWYVSNRVVPVEVVGVVEDVRNESPDRAPNPDVFVEYHRMLALQRQWGDSAHLQAETTIGFLSFAIRTTDDPQLAAHAIAGAVHAVDTYAGIDGMRPMEQLVSSAIARPRFYAIVFGVFAAVAAVLAAIGVYGVLAYAVAQRTQEIGIRMALGAQKGQVIALVLCNGALLAVVGVAVGLAGAAVASRLLQGMLFGITPLDLRTFIGVAVTFGLVAVAAAYLPARRATRVDPLVALRSE
jgi:hypothetical protein